MNRCCRRYSQVRSPFNKTLNVYILNLVDPLPLNERKAMNKISSPELYVRIMDYLEDMEDIYIETPGMKHKLDKETLVVIAALNVVLVKNDTRLAYMESVLSDLADHIVSLDSELMLLPIVKEEPLIILRKNKTEAIDIIKTGRNIHEIMGTLLGYQYVGPNWRGINNAYTVHYMAIDEEHKTYPLYSYNVPESEYTDDVKRAIKDDVDRFNLVLNDYGYVVKVK